MKCGENLWALRAHDSGDDVHDLIPDAAVPLVVVGGVIGSQD